MCKFLELIWTVRDNVWTVWVRWVMIYAISVLVCRRPEIAMELGSTKWTRCLVSGLPTDSPLLYFGTVKNSPGFV